MRKLEPFRRFLFTAAQMGGQIVSFSRIAREAGYPQRRAVLLVTRSGFQDNRRRGLPPLGPKTLSEI